MLKSYKDYKKVAKVIDSCDTLGQLQVASNMSYHYGKMYGFCHLWSILDKTIDKILDDTTDRLNYEERLMEIQEDG